MHGPQMISFRQLIGIGTLIKGIIFLLVEERKNTDFLISLAIIGIRSSCSYLKEAFLRYALMTGKIEAIEIIFSLSVTSFLSKRYSYWFVIISPNDLVETLLLSV